MVSTEYQRVSMECQRDEEFHGVSTESHGVSTEYMGAQQVWRIWV